MARSETSTVLQHAVVLAYGPASATGAAVRHARTIVGDDGTVEVVAPTRQSRPLLDRLPAGAEPIEKWGIAALRNIAERHSDHLFLLIHDDVTLSRRGAEELATAAQTHRRPAVPWSNDPGVSPHLTVKRPKHAGDLDQYARSATEKLLAGSIGFSCIVATGTQLSSPIDRLIHIPAVRLDGIPAVAGAAVAHHSRRCIERLPEGTGPDGRPLLVANLIVRDEADNIEACLSSLDGLVDRVEVLDTGSTDNTVSLARAAGANIGEVDWRDDFGWARNQVLERSRDAWFALWIDADERLTAADPDYFRRILASIAGDIEGLSIQVHNRGENEAITSSFFANRIFSTDGTRFEGALHERLITRDGTPLNAVEAHSIVLDHYGYLDDVVDEKEKYLRNLDLAKREYKEDPSPRRAYEYAQALGLGNAAAELRVELLNHAIEGDLEGAGLANVHAALAHARIDTSDYEGAIAAANIALDLVPSDDLAGAALARAATEVGDYETVADIRAEWDREGPRPLFEIKSNRALIDSLAAAALIRLGRVDEIKDRLEPHLRDPETIRWPTIVAAAATTSDPLESLRPLVRADLSGKAVAAAAHQLAPADTARLALERAEVGSPSADTIAAGLLAAAIAGDRDLIEALTAHRNSLPSDVAQTVADRLAARGFTDFAAILSPRTAAAGGPNAEEAITDLIPRNGRVLDLRTDPLPVSENRRFDAVIIGAAAEPSLLEQIKTVIDPAGIVLAWDPPAAPSSLLHIGGSTASPSASTPSTLTTDLIAAGYHPVSAGPVTIARPELDEALLKVVMESQSADTAVAAHDIGVVLIGSPTPETMLWLRASIPGRLRMTALQTIEHSGELDAVDTGRVGRVLVVPGSVVAEPEWIGSLLDAGEPAGVGLLNSSGVVIHAGATTGGAVFASGTRQTQHAVLETDRLGIPLLAPFVCSAGDLSSELSGRFLGGRFARSTEAAWPAGDQAALSDLVEDAVILAIVTGPSSLPAPLGETFERIVRTSDGSTPVVVCGTEMAPADINALRRLGAHVFDRSSAPIAAVAAAFQPRSVLYFGTAAFDDFHGAAVGGAPAAAHIAIGYEGLQAELADALLDSYAPTEAITDVAAPVPPEPSIAAISPLSDTLAGTVSVVIPVWNNWEYTEACLESLAAHPEAPLEIVVVDNGSTDQTPAELRRRDDIVVITNQDNLGFPTAVNQGLAASHGEYICVLNNDTVVTAGWLTEMLKALEVPGTGMVGPRSNQISGLQIVPDSPPLSNRGAAERWARRFVRGREGSHWLTNRLVGFCLLARRSLFEEVGGFDQGFGIGNYEDDELGARVRASGHTLRVADASLVLHHGGATFSKLGIDYGALMAKAGRHFGQRTANPSGLLTAVVLSDGTPAGAAATARSALAVADRVRIVERAGFPIAEIESGALRTIGIELLHHDWHEPEGAAASLEGIDDHLVLICEAGETIDVPDWSTARIALENAPAGPLEVRTASGFEVRFDRPEPDAIARFGTSADHRISELQIRA